MIPLTEHFVTYIENKPKEYAIIFYLELRKKLIFKTYFVTQY